MINYNIFLENIKIENINESLIFFSPLLRKLLHRANNNISKDLLSIEGIDIKSDVTYINFDKDDYLTFTTMRNAKRIVIKKHPHLSNIDQFGGSDGIRLADEFYNMMGNINIANVYGESRSQIKIGRLINKFFPNKYTDKEVEEFVNKFKSTIIKSGEEFIIVEGPDIEYWYDSNLYRDSSGQLGNSCMKSQKDIFDIYIKNPEFCRMLILLEDGLLIGRALIWKFSKMTGVDSNNKYTDFRKIGVEYYMDRQYTSSDSMVNKFKKYADDNNWAYKLNNNHYSYNVILYKEIRYEDVIIEVKLNKNINYDTFPYLDTLRRYNPNECILFNDNNSNDIECYILDSTDGSYTDNINRGNYSNFYSEYIPDDDSVWSDPLDDYLWRSDAVQVLRGRNRGYYPEGYVNIRYSGVSDEFLHNRSCVYSKKYSTYIYSEEAVNVVFDISSMRENWYPQDDDSILPLSEFEKSLWYKKTYISSDYTHILSELMIDNYKGELIPNSLSVTTYAVKGKKDLYLEKEYSISLGLSINIRDKRVMDKYEYENILKNYETK